MGEKLLSVESVKVKVLFARKTEELVLFAEKPEMIFSFG